MVTKKKDKKALKEREKALRKEPLKAFDLTKEQRDKAKKAGWI